MKKLFLLLFVVLLCGAAFGQTAVTGTGAPQMYAQLHLTGQTAAITKTAWKVLPAGTYRVTCQAKLTTQGGSGVVDVNVFFVTPASGSEVTYNAFCRITGNASLNSYGGTGSGSTAQSAVVTISPGNNFSYSTSFSSTGAVYSMDLILEKLN